MQEENEEQLKPIRRGWCLGSPEFRERMLEQLEQNAGENPSAEVRRESAVAKCTNLWLSFFLWVYRTWLT